MASLLTYIASTDPIPLRVSTPGAITVAVNNPGGYSDQPTEDYVAVTSIVLSFGTPGTDGDELTDATSTIQVTPPTSLINHQPVSWTVQRDGLTFTFTPPSGGEQIFPSAGLTFVFAGIPVNDKVGTVTLSITEIASSPGDPANPSLFPPQKKQARTREPQIKVGKFPKNFAVGQLIACAAGVTPCTTEVQTGNAVDLSWKGSAGATYRLEYSNKIITHHHNGTALGNEDTYPNPNDGDAPLTLEESTSFTLVVTYTPPGGEPATFERFAQVSVYSQPKIGRLTLYPSFFPLSKVPAPTTLTWQVEGTDPTTTSPVQFTIDPPLSKAEEQKNGDFFNTGHTASGQQDLYFDQGHRLTLTALGQGDLSATQSIYARSCAVKELPMQDQPQGVAVSPDGQYAFVTDTNTENDTISVIKIQNGTEPSTWTVETIPYSAGAWAVAVSPDGQYAFVPASSDGTLSVIRIQDNTKPSLWDVETISLGLDSSSYGVAISPDGQYAFVTNYDINTISVIKIQNGTKPSTWTVDTISQKIDSNPSAVAVSPDSQYALVTNGDNTVSIIKIQDGTKPSTWTVETISQNIGVLPAGVAVSPDGQYAFVVNSNLLSSKNGTVSVIEIQEDTAPSTWTVEIISQNIGVLPAGVAVSPDGQYAFVVNSNLSSNNNGTVSVIEIQEDTAPSTWTVRTISQNIGSDSNFMGIAISPDGQYVFCNSVIELIPAASPPSATPE